MSYYTSYIGLLSITVPLRTVKSIWWIIIDLRCYLARGIRMDNAVDFMYPYHYSGCDWSVVYRKGISIIANFAVSLWRETWTALGNVWRSRLNLETTMLRLLWLTISIWSLSQMIRSIPKFYYITRFWQLPCKKGPMSVRAELPLTASGKVAENLTSSFCSHCLALGFTIYV